MIITERSVKQKVKAIAKELETELAKQSNASDKSDPNEADTRARYIDEFFKAFGWTAADIAREQYVPGAGYIDYTLVVDNVDQIVVEAKRLSHSINDEDIEQLAKYFNNTAAHVGILTNGIEYWFFSWDPYKKNKPQRMNPTPFARINIQHLDVSRRDNFIMYLKRSKFDVRRIKWVSHADYIRRSLYICLGGQLGGDNSTIAWEAFKAIFSTREIDGEIVDYEYVKAVFEHTKYHSRYKYRKGIQEW